MGAGVRANTTELWALGATHILDSQTRSWADDREAGGYSNAPSEDFGWPQMSLPS
jgi:hypothetical protein